MYVAPEDWSLPEANDPAPCFRQGDVVRLNWARPTLKVQDTDNGTLATLANLEVRDELVVLVSACCDLVIRPDKRKGVLVCPLREVPKSVANKADRLAALKMTAQQANETHTRVPANLFWFDKHAGIRAEQVVHLEALSMVEYDVLKRAVKIAELTHDARAEFRERVKLHFTHDV